MRFAFLLFAVALGAQTDELALKSQRAAELMSAGRFAEAIPIYQELVKALPDEPRLRVNLGLAQQMAGQCRNAVRQFEAVATALPSFYPLWASLGACYFELGEPAKAIPPLQKAIELAPREPQPRKMLSDALYLAGRFELAARQFRAIADMDTADPRAWYGLGKSYEALSEAAFQRLAKAAPASAWLFALRAEIGKSQQQYPSALALYRDALAKMPKLRGANLAMAEIYRSTGHPDWAATAEKREQSLPPPDCAAAKQECAFRAGRFLEATKAASTTPESEYWRSRAFNALAMQAFARLAQLPPSMELHWLNAQIAAARRNHVEAANELREALKLAPGDPNIRTDLAAALHAAGDHAAALSVLRDLLPANPESPQLNFVYGDTLLALEEVEKAVPPLEKAVARQPGNLHAQAALGIAYARAGQPEKALPHLKAAASIDKDGRIYYQLARALQATDQPDAASQAMQKYQELQKPPSTEIPQITPP